MAAEEEQVRGREAQRIREEQEAAETAAHEARVRSNRNHIHNQDHAKVTLSKLMKAQGNRPGLRGWDFGETFWHLLGLAAGVFLAWCALTKGMVGGGIIDQIISGILAFLVLRFYALAMPIHQFRMARLTRGVGCGDQSCSRCKVTYQSDYYDSRMP